jgi:hypothetical protein
MFMQALAEAIDFSASSNPSAASMVAIELIRRLSSRQSAQYSAAVPEAAPKQDLAR